MRHFLIECNVGEHATQCTAWGEYNQVPPHYGETISNHRFYFRNGNVHVRSYGESISRAKARAIVQAWFNGAFATTNLKEKS